MSGIKIKSYRQKNFWCVLRNKEVNNYIDHNMQKRQMLPPFWLRVYVALYNLYYITALLIVIDSLVPI